MNGNYFLVPFAIQNGNWEFMKSSYVKLIIAGVSLIRSVPFGTKSLQAPCRKSPGRWSLWRKRPSAATEHLRMSPTWIRTMRPGRQQRGTVRKHWELWNITLNYVKLWLWNLTSDHQTSLPRPMMSTLYFHGQSTPWTPNSRRCLVTTTLKSRSCIVCLPSWISKRLFLKLEKTQEQKLTNFVFFLWFGWSRITRNP